MASRRRRLRTNYDDDRVPARRASGAGRLRPGAGVHRPSRRTSRPSSQAPWSQKLNALILLVLPQPDLARRLRLRGLLVPRGLDVGLRGPARRRGRHRGGRDLPRGGGRGLRRVRRGGRSVRARAGRAARREADAADARPAPRDGRDPGKARRSRRRVPPAHRPDPPGGRASRAAASLAAPAARRPSRAGRRDVSDGTLGPATGSSGRTGWRYLGYALGRAVTTQPRGAPMKRAALRPRARRSRALPRCARRRPGRQERRLERSSKRVQGRVQDEEPAEGAARGRQGDGQERGRARPPRSSSRSSTLSRSTPAKLRKECGHGRGGLAGEDDRLEAELDLAKPPSSPRTNAITVTDEDAAQTGWLWTAQGRGCPTPADQEPKVRIEGLYERVLEEEDFVALHLQDPSRAW